MLGIIVEEAAPFPVRLGHHLASKQFPKSPATTNRVLGLVLQRLCVCACAQTGAVASWAELPRSSAKQRLNANKGFCSLYCYALSFDNFGVSLNKDRLACSLFYLF